MMPNIPALVRSEQTHILVGLPLTNPTGKIRVKRKGDKFDFGHPIATRQSVMDDNCYIEWQIGYDNPNPSEPGVIGGLDFFTRDKHKFAFELSAILYTALVDGIYPTEVLIDLLSFANTVSDGELIEEITTLSRAHLGSRNVKGLTFNVIEEKYPLYLLEGRDYEIEVIVRHKQRAVGYQSMVYVCLPVKNAEESVIGRVANKREIVNFKVFQEQNNFVCDAIRVFALASKRHNEDIKSILAAINGKILNPGEP